jgi:hypothetical protein
MSVNTTVIYWVSIFTKEDKMILAVIFSTQCGFDRSFAVNFLKVKIDMKLSVRTEFAYVCMERTQSS